MRPVRVVRTPEPPLRDEDGRLLDRLLGMAEGRVDGLILGGLMYWMAQIVDQELERYLAEQLPLQEGSGPVGTPTARAQQLVIQHFDTPSLEEAVRNVVRQRVDEVLEYAGSDSGGRDADNYKELLDRMPPEGVGGARSEPDSLRAQIKFGGRTRPRDNPDRSPGH